MFEKVIIEPVEFIPNFCYEKMNENTKKDIRILNELAYIYFLMNELDKKLKILNQLDKD